MTPRLSRRLLAWLAVACALLGPMTVVAGDIEVEIQGVEEPLRANVRAYLSIVAEAERVTDDEPIPAATVRRLHARAEREITRALEPFGYYRPRVNAELERLETGWRARYDIDLGEPVRIETVDIRVEGAASDDSAFAERLAALPLTEGQRLNHGDYENAKSRLTTLASERGYIDARWQKRRLEVEPETNSARIELVLDSGPRYRYGEIDFDETVVSESFLRRYLPFEQGQPYVASELLDLQYRLDDSNYFQSVSVRARRQQASDRRIPVEVDLEARPKHRYTFGIGFGTDTGARVSFGRDTRYTNDSGHRLEMVAQVAQRATEAEARYVIPLTEPWRERLALETSLTEEEVGDGETRQFELGIARITSKAGWQRRLSLTYQRSRDEIGDEVDTRDLVIPGIALSRSAFNDPVYATRGYGIAGDLRGGSASLGSDVSFSRLLLQARGLTELWSDARLLGRLEGGRVWVDGVVELPLSQRFFAGGDNSVRGFAYQSLGPEDEQGRVIGGRYLAVASLELEQLVWGNWGAAVFADHGNAVNDTDADLRTGAGVGMRYRSPVGVFRVDIAKAVDGDEAPRVHLSLGVNF